MWLVITTIIVAGMLAGGMAALYWLTERPATVHFHDNRAIYFVSMGPAHNGRRLEATWQECDMIP